MTKNWKFETFIDNSIFKRFFPEPDIYNSLSNGSVAFRIPNEVPGVVAQLEEARKFKTCGFDYFRLNFGENVAKVEALLSGGVYENDPYTYLMIKWWVRKDKSYEPILYYTNISFHRETYNNSNSASAVSYNYNNKKGTTEVLVNIHYNNFISREFDKCVVLDSFINKEK